MAAIFLPAAGLCMIFALYLIHRRASFRSALDGAVRAAALRSRRTGLMRPRSPHYARALLRRVVRMNTPLPAVQLVHRHGRDLSIALLRLRRAAYALPPLPVSGGEIRMAALCRALLARCDAPTPQDLLSALRDWQSTARTTVSERESLAVVMQLVLQGRLSQLLFDLLPDAAQYRRGLRLAGRLMRSRRPVRMLLRRRRPDSACLCALIDALRDAQQHELLAALDGMMRESGTSFTRVREKYTHRQATLARRLDETIAALSQFQHADWPALCEAEDPLHALFLHDPAGCYPRLTAASRADLRRYAARLAARFRADEARAAHACLEAAHAAQDDTPRDHVGFYLLTESGQFQLRQLLQSRAGWLRTFISGRTPVAAMIAAGLLSLCGGWLMLDLTQRLFPAIMLLALLFPLLNALCRRFAQRCFGMPHPAVDVPVIDERIRTLIVLPAELHDASDAVSAMRHLLIARDACPTGAVDVLLLADYHENLTVRASTDAEISAAARTAAGAIDQPGMRALYLQRQRSRDPGGHGFSGLHGKSGLLTMLQNLLLQGECPDAIDDATIDPAELRHRYAYVLVLTEDAQLLPDALPALIGAMEYPLFRSGPDGGSMLVLRSAALRRRPAHARLLVLYQPDALAEALSGLPDASPYPAAAACAHARISRQIAAVFRKSPTAHDLPDRAEAVQSLFHSLPWLGMEGIPAAFSLLSPVWALLLVLWGGVMRNPSAVMLALALHAASSRADGFTGLARSLVLLPYHAAVHIAAAATGLRGLLRSQPYHTGRAASLFTPRRTLLTLCWVQSLSAVLLIACSVLALPPEWASLAAGVLFACFPLPFWLEDRLPRASAAPDAATEHHVRDIARVTWRYFESLADESPLPPDSIQAYPPRGPSGETSPGAIAGVLLAAVSACDQSLIPPEDAARRIERLLVAVSALERRNGLLYDRYHTEDLQPAAPLRIGSAANGLLCCALMIAAQALRSRLADIPEDLRSLPARLDALAGDMNLRSLLDASTGLLHERLALPGRTGEGLHAWFSSPALTAVFIAVMRRELPASHLSRLLRASVRDGLRRAPLSATGSVADFALPPLLLPCPAGQPWHASVRAALQMHVRRPVHGLIGLSDALSPVPDASLRSRMVSSGLPLLAARLPGRDTLISPHAAAMLLPWFPAEASAALSALEAASMLSDVGFCDGHDPTNSGQPARAFSTLHQALLLCACGAALGVPPAKHFAALPGAAAWSPLLQLHHHDAPVLSPLVVRRQAAAHTEPPASRAPFRLRIPPDAHLIGSRDASALVTGDGCTVLQGESLLWTRFTGSACLPEGLRFCASDGRRTVRIGSGQAEFHEGSAVFHETLGKLRISLRVVADPIGGVVWHVADVANGSGSARQLRLCSFLPVALDPDGAGDDSAIVTDRPDDRVLTAARPGQTGMLCHTVSASVRLTDVFAARDASRVDPGFAAALRVPCDISPCLSFAAGAEIPGRSRVTVAFATAFIHGDVPAAMRTVPPESVLTAAHMISRIQQEQLALSADRAMHVLRLTPYLFWHGLPCQGAACEITAPQRELCALGINLLLPLLLISVAADDFASLLADCCAAAALLGERGFPIGLCILCRGDDSAGLADLARRLLEEIPCTADGIFPCSVLDAAALPDSLRSTLEASARLILTDSRELLPQLRAMTSTLRDHPLPAPEPVAAPEAAHLLFGDASGGFHPNTREYVHLAAPEDAAPAAWTRMVADRRFGTRVSAEGPLASFAGPMLSQTMTHHAALPAEAFFLDEGGVRLSPCLFPYGAGSVLHVHHAPGCTVWQADGSGLSLRLTLATVPGCSAGVRVLRIRNLTDHPREMTLHAAACFSPGEPSAAPCTWVTLMPGLAAAKSPESHLTAYLASLDGAGDAARMTLAEYHAFLALHGASGEPDANADGSVAMLSRRVTLAPGSTAHFTFLVGAARTMDDLEHTLDHVRTRGASAVIRLARQKWADRLRHLTVSTPDEALNLLMNQLLPCFLHTPHPEQTVLARLLASSASILLGGSAMRPRLLNAFTRMTRTDPDRILLPLLTAWYVDRTGDDGVLAALLPETDDVQPDRDPVSLRCEHILTGVTLSHDGLPLVHGEPSRLQGLRYVTALRAYMPHLPPALVPDAQRMTDLVTEAVRRTPADDRPCLHSCWEVFAGIASSLPEACDPADFREAAALLHALCLTGDYPAAWQLAAWLNPAQHRAAHIPPWQPEADGSAMHSALLYATILESLLGLRRHGDGFSLHPHLPGDWDGFSLQLIFGAATWHVDCSRSVDAPQCDGLPLPDGLLHPADDGRIHQVRFPAQ